MRFSQRIGKRPVKDIIQVEAIDEDLTNRLWNVILENFLGRINSNDGEYHEDSTRGKIFRIIWKNFFNKPLDQIPSYSNSPVVNETGFITYLRNWFYKGEWYDKFDLIEYLVYIDHNAVHNELDQKCNKALENEVSGYRIIDGKIIQITSEEEIETIEEALVSSEKWNSVNTHLKTALDFLADKKNPDYRNSIKESISAIESFSKIIVENNNATLGKALAIIERKHLLPPTLKSAFSALYGYTSDAGGIRHALLEGDVEVGFAEAKFMLVTCSAFINYLKSIWK